MVFGAGGGWHMVPGRDKPGSFSGYINYKLEYTTSRDSNPALMSAIPGYSREIPVDLVIEVL